MTFNCNPNSISWETDCISYAHKLIVPYPQFIHDEINKAKKPRLYSLLNCHESSDIYRMQLCIWNVLQFHPSNAYHTQVSSIGLNDFLRVQHIWKHWIWNWFSIHFPWMGCTTLQKWKMDLQFWRWWFHKKTTTAMLFRCFVLIYRQLFYIWLYMITS